MFKALRFGLKVRVVDLERNAATSGISSFCGASKSFPIASHI